MVVLLFLVGSSYIKKKTSIKEVCGITLGGGCAAGAADDLLYLLENKENSGGYFYVHKY